MTDQPVLLLPVGRVSSWRTVNISTVERSGRVVMGAAAAVAGILLIIAAGSVLVVIPEVLLVVAGLDLVITGALGHCPLYAKLGHIPKSLARIR